MTENEVGREIVDAAYKIHSVVMFQDCHAITKTSFAHFAFSRESFSLCLLRLSVR